MCVSMSGYMCLIRLKSPGSAVTVECSGTYGHPAVLFKRAVSAGQGEVVGAFF